MEDPLFRGVLWDQATFKDFVSEIKSNGKKKIPPKNLIGVLVKNNMGSF